MYLKVLYKLPNNIKMLITVSASLDLKREERSKKTQKRKKWEKEKRTNSDKKTFRKKHIENTIMGGRGYVLAFF